MKQYLLDSNVFIQAHRMHYPFDVVPSFWKKLMELSNKKIILSIDKVKKELCTQDANDVLSQWCQNEVDKAFFIETQDCVSQYADIAVWAHNHDNYTQNAKDEFLATDLADPWLIAYAMKNNCLIVTHETSQPLAKKRIKIPEPCDHFGIKFLTPIEMLRELKEQL